MSMVRRVLEWVNNFRGFPQEFGPVEAEFLGRRGCLSLSIESAPVKILEFISGGFTAQLHFGVRLRIAAVGSAQRLEALESLDALAVWLQNSLPILDRGLRALAVEQAAPPVLENRSEDGTETFLARFVLTYQTV